MLFNSYEFVFCFLPVVVILFFLAAKKSHLLAAFFLACSSLVFYGWLLPQFLILLLASIVVNYGFARAILANKKTAWAKRILVIAVTANLVNIGVFKYTKFFLVTANTVFGIHIPLPELLLPLGISFFTFTQIAFLVDVYRGQARETNFIHYLLFVTYFPHLIAGPIIHHAQVMPQFRQPETYRFQSDKLAFGLAIFTIGLAKKILLADQFAGYADPIFKLAEHGDVLSFDATWTGVLAYTLQLYFDFSGYSDMAIGLSQLFGIKLPVNFASPYKATSIIDFWRRWHMTLSEFLLRYLYIPLGGNQHGSTRRYINLGLTMLLGGLWHGASWTFVVWGGLHGFFLMINHGWRAATAHRPAIRFLSPLTLRLLQGALTFACVVFAWIFFRAETLTGALNVLKGCAAMGQGFYSNQDSNLFFIDIPATGMLVLGLLLVWCMPNTQELFSYQATAACQTAETKGKGWRLRWNTDPLTGLLLGCLFCFCLANFYKLSTFLYYQF